MIISAINAMTMTPARAASIFATRRSSALPEAEGPPRREEAHGRGGKEALPWWFFALLGGWISMQLLARHFAGSFGLPAGEEGEAVPATFKTTLRQYAVDLLLAIPGLIAGGIVGRLIIRPVNWALGCFFQGFNFVFDWATRAYGRIVGWMLRFSVVMVVLYVGLIGLTGYGFSRVPFGFIPSQDKGRLYINVQLPDSAALERTTEVMAKVEKIALETPGVAYSIGNPGRSFVLNSTGPNLGTAFIGLEPFDKRRDPKLGAESIIAQLRKRFREEIPEARLNVFGAPAIDGLGNAGGFKLMVEAAGDVNYGQLQDQGDKLAAHGNRQPGLVGLFNGFRARTPQLRIDIDRTKVRTMGVSLTDLFDTLQVYLGGYYVNDFNRFGRTWQVNLQADAPFRAHAATIKNLKVRNSDGDMALLGAVVDIKDARGPLTVTRYNMFPAATITGASLPGVSTGDVLAAMENLAAKELPRNMKAEWTELSLLQKRANTVEQFRDLRQNPFSAFALGAILVFFVLSGLYESWSLPLAVILVVPLCLSSALAGIIMAHMDVNIFVQVGFVVLVGLATKNAILVVEFARDRQLEGESIFNAAVEAARVRLRPILMTSFAFVLGVLPLVVSHGAGAEMRRTLGTAVFAGMIGVTCFGLFLTPVFFYVVRGLVRSKPPQPREQAHQPTEPVKEPV
jgi:multidrug efflux pump